MRRERGPPHEKDGRVNALVMALPTVGEWSPPNQRNRAYLRFKHLTRHRRSNTEAPGISGQSCGGRG